MLSKRFVAFGADAWQVSFGVDVGEEPDLPPDIDAILDAKCPFTLVDENTERRVRDNHVLVLIPAAVDGEKFTLRKLGELTKKYFPDSKDGYNGLTLVPTEPYYDDYENKSDEAKNEVLPDTPYWVLMTRGMLKDSPDKSYTDQKTMAAKYSGDGYEIPHILEAATAILTHYVRTKEHLLGSSDMYASCPAIGKFPQHLIIGGLDKKNGIGIFTDSDGPQHCHGVVCRRKF